MFNIENRGFFHNKRRLVAPTTLAQADFYKIADRIGCKPFKARKSSIVAAREAEHLETIETRWNGKETINTAHPGDWIVTNLSPNREVLRDQSGNENSYVIKAEVFQNTYDAIAGGNAFGRFFTASNLVDAVYLSGGFDICAPWGQQQIARAGYLLLRDGEVYGNNASTFEATYEILH